MDFFVLVGAMLLVALVAFAGGYIYCCFQYQEGIQWQRRRQEILDIKTRTL